MVHITKKHKGFTLVELSIVIVIVALIIAGVSAGKSLVRNHGLRKVASDIQNLQSVANTFKLQYNKYPGDINNAYSYWGSNCASSASNCNGNGDGKILSVYKEEYMSFKHLSLAGLIPGTYTGAIGSGPIPGTNLPAGPFSNSGYSIAYTDSIYFVGTYWNTNSIGNFIVFGTPVADIMRGSAISPSELSSIDTKLDDGIPYLGKILSAQINSGCTVASSAPTTYDLSKTTNVCAIKYKL